MRFGDLYADDNIKPRDPKVERLLEILIFMGFPLHMLDLIDDTSFSRVVAELHSNAQICGCTDMLNSAINTLRKELSA